MVRPQARPLTGVRAYRLFLCRKNNVSNFIPDRQPDFPDQKFETVTGDPFFVDENLLVKTDPSRPEELRSDW